MANGKYTIKKKDTRYQFEGFNPFEVALEWGGDQLSGIYHVALMTDLADRYKAKLPPAILNAVGAGWDFFKNFAANIEEIRRFKQLDSASRHKREKGARIIFNTVLKDLNNSSKLLSVLSLSGALSGAAAAVLTPLTAFTLASGAWAVAGFSAVQLHRSIKKYNDPAYWLEGEVTKYEKVAEKINQHHQRLTELKEYSRYVDRHKEQLENTINLNPNAENVALLNAKILIADKQKEKIEKEIKQTENKINTLEKVGAHLEKKSLAIAQVKFSNEKPIPDNLKERLATIVSANRSIHNKSASDNKSEMNFLLEKPSAGTVKLVRELERNQRETIINRTINSIGLFTAATGMTLVALSPFTGPAAPAVMATGFVITALGTAAQLAPPFVNRVVNTIAQKHQNKLVRAELLEKYDQKIDNKILEGLSAEEKLRFRFSFELSFASLLAKFPHKSEHQLEAIWYNSLKNLDDNSRNKLLKTAEAKIINNTILAKVLDVKSDDPLLETLSSKEKKQITDRVNRQVLKTDLTAKLQATLHLKKEAVDLPEYKFGSSN